MPKRDEICKWIGTIGLLTTLVLLSTGGFAATNRPVKQVNSVGTAIIHEKNLADGKQNAVNDALIAAVGQAVMEMLTGETVVRRFQLINDQILARPDDYVQNYRVLAESVSGVTVRTLVQVDVAVDRLSRDMSRMGLALSGTTFPRVLFMIAEKKATDSDYRYWWGTQGRIDRTVCEEAMVKALRSAGFEIVDPPELNKPLGLAVTLTDAEIAALAARLGADVVVSGVGSAAAASNTLGGTVQGFEAAVEARALHVKTGQSMGRTRQKSVASAQEAAIGSRDALAGAGALAGDDLARQVMAAWQQDQDRGTVIEVVVEGTGGHIASFVRLRTDIAALSGVKELKMKEMAADRAVMAVNYQGTARSMADALLLKTFSGFGIDIYEVTAETVRIRLVNR